MRRSGVSGGFFLCLLMNIVFNLDKALPAVILLILHFSLGLSVIWFWAAIGIWLMWIIIVTSFLKWVNHCGNSMPVNVNSNKNPYSAKTNDILPSEVNNRSDKNT